MTTRELVLSRLTQAFTTWETEYRNDPDGYMSKIELEATDPTNVGEMRARYLVQLLNDIPFTTLKA